MSAYSDIFSLSIQAQLHFVGAQATVDCLSTFLKLSSRRAYNGRRERRPLNGGIRLRIGDRAQQYVVHGYSRIRPTCEMNQQPRIRFSPRELCVPESEPFKFDLLARKRSCEWLTELAIRVDGPCTIAIDAAWGNGKTTFLRLWATHLKKCTFSVIELNAWKTDYFKDPFLAIVGELTKQLEASDLSDTQNGIDLAGLKESFTKLIAKVPHIAATRVGLTREEADMIIGSFKSDVGQLLEQYEEQLASVEAFRSKLKGVGQGIRRKTEKPLIVLIDELDRCRPTYAIEFLEVVKHLMSVDDVVYVFAMNRSALSHAVSGCYGTEFDGSGYLRRFFDVDFKLPLPSREQFIYSIVDELNLTSVMDSEDAKETARLLKTFFGVDTVSLRQVQQALFRFKMALVLGGLDTRSHPKYAQNVCVALILRVYDQEIFREFVKGNKLDLEVVESLLSGAVKDDSNLNGERLVFETTLILAAQEVADERTSSGRYATTPLLQFYGEVAAETSTDRHTYEERYFAERILKIMDDFRYPDLPRRYFKLAVEHLEVLELFNDFN